MVHAAWPTYLDASEARPWDRNGPPLGLVHKKHHFAKDRNLKRSWPKSGDAGKDGAAEKMARWGCSTRRKWLEPDRVRCLTTFASGLVFLDKPGPSAGLPRKLEGVAVKAEAWAKHPLYKYLRSIKAIRAKIPTKIIDVTAEGAPAESSVKRYEVMVAGAKRGLYTFSWPNFVDSEESVISGMVLEDGKGGFLDVYPPRISVDSVDVLQAIDRDGDGTDELLLEVSYYEGSGTFFGSLSPFAPGGDRKPTFLEIFADGA